MKLITPIIVLCAALLSLALPMPLQAASSIEKLATLSAYNALKISPSGTYIAASLFSENKSSLVFFDTVTMKVVDVMRFRDPDEIGAFYWVSDERVVLQVNSHIDNHEEVFNLGEIFAITVGKTKGDFIFGYRASLPGGKSARKKQVAARQRSAGNAWGTVIDLLPDEPKQVLISAVSWSTDQSGNARIYRLNTDTGKLVMVTKVPMDYADVFTNGYGNIIGATGLVGDNNDSKVMLYDSTSKSWQVSKVLSEAAGFDFVAFDAMNQQIYYIEIPNEGQESVNRFNLKTNKIDTAYTHPSLDITDVLSMSDAEKPYAVRIDPDYPAYEWLDDSSSGQFFKQLTNVFKGYVVSISSFTRNRSKYIIHAASDRDPGSYYLFDKAKNKLSLLLRQQPEIDAKQMLPTKAFSFKTSDEVTLHGYLTSPKGKVTADTPSVMLVHGGPHSVRDYWTFDLQVQLLAGAGYQVIQVNYRGSYGYGTEFTVAGAEHWGDLIQQDISQTVDWLAEQKMINNKKVCIMGHSFGAYSAVMNSILYPDKYRCVIATAGVYDLGLMSKVGDIVDLTYGKDTISAMVGTDKQIIKQFSPSHQVEKLSKPLLLVHGEKDKRAPLAHAERLLEGLKEHQKSYQYIEMEGTGHSFNSYDDRLSYFKAVLAFLAKHNPVSQQ